MPRLRAWDHSAKKIKYAIPADGGYAGGLYGGAGRRVAKLLRRMLRCPERMHQSGQISTWDPRAQPLASSIVRRALQSGAVIATLMASSISGHAQAICPGAHVMLDTSVGSSPFVFMRLADREGWFLIDTGATYSSVDARTFGFRPGAKVNLSGSSLPTIGGGVFRVADLTHSKAPGTHVGTIGTDFLSRRTVEVHYDTRKPYMVISEQPCSSQQLINAGFIPIGQRGH